MPRHFLVLLLLAAASCSDEERPAIGELLTSSKLVEGKKFFLTCHLNSGKPPNEFEWSLNGRRIVADDKVTINQHEDYSHLNIWSINSDYNGEFTCIVRNRFGEDSRTVSIRLNGRCFRFSDRFVTKLLLTCRLIEPDFQ